MAKRLQDPEIVVKDAPHGPLLLDDTVPGENGIDTALVKRLRTALERVGGKAAASRLSKVPIGTLNNYLAGRDIRRAALLSLAAATGVRLEWLAAGVGPIVEDTAADVTLIAPDGTVTAAQLKRYVTIPRYNVSASAGGGAALAEHPQVVEYLAFAEDFLRLRLHRRGDELGLIEARGDSMEPTIRDGDVLTIDIRADQPIENGRLYVIQVGDALLVKRVELRLTSIKLHSDNPRYSPETIDRADAEQLHIIGQVLLVSAPPR